MLCNTRQPSPLEAYAKSLHDEGSADEQVLFPMYTVRLEAVLQMTTVEPHEVLKLQKLLVEFEPKLGKALFVSHQWVGKRHPDPEFTQFSVLQGALKHMMSELQRVDLDVRTEVALPSAKAFVTRALKTEPIYVWYDYFSCPQLEHISSHGDVAPLDSGGMSNLAKAVSSIPLYVATCTFFFALCPSLESEDHSQMLNPHSWASRGWCRVERCCRELSPEHSWVMIRSATQTELISSPVATPGAGAPGEGVFTVEADRQRLGPVMLKALQRKLQFLLKCGDLVGYRVLLNHQPLFLRGFNVETVYDFIPGYDKGLSLETGASSLVSKFFYHNGFSKIHEVDKVGWTPLHYAGCRGEPQLVRALLELRANPNVKAAKDNVMAGALPKWRVMTSISACRHHEAARILIEAKADLSGTQLVGACIGNDPEGIRILCEVGGVSPHAADHEGGHGVLAIHLACMYGATAALEELVAQAARGKQSVDLSNILWLATSFGNCSAEMVDFLVKLKADVNEQWNLPLTNPLGLLVRVTSLRHRFGTPTHFTRMAFHAKGATPLMQAVMGGQWEAAAALVARGARIDARNARGYTAADLARSPPAFLAQAFQGDSRGCLRVVSLELASVDSPAETKEEAEEAEADDELIQLYF